MVAGSSSSEDAKIGGMTPAELTLSGRNDDSPPTMRLPCWRLGYWISRRRCERSMKTMNTIIATDMPMMASSVMISIWPLAQRARRC